MGNIQPIFFGPRCSGVFVWVKKLCCDGFSRIIHRHFVDFFQKVSQLHVYHWCNIYILFGVLEKSDQLGDFTVNTSDYIDWLGEKQWPKNTLMYLGLSIDPWVVWCFSKWSRNVYCIRIKSFTSRPWMRWWVINQPIFWYSLMAIWTKLLGMTTLDGRNSSRYGKKKPLFTTGETYMSGGVLFSPDFWLPSTVVTFIGKNFGTWNPQSPPKLKVDGNGEINNHFPCKSSSNWSFANWNWFFFWYQEAARDRWQLKYVVLFLKCSFFGVSWSNLTSICFRWVGEKPPIRKIKFQFLSHGPLA